MITVSLDSVRAAALALVAERGEDYRYSLEEYENCFYIPVLEAENPNDPRLTSGCLVGEILLAHGVNRSLMDTSVTADRLITALVIQGTVQTDGPLVEISNWLMDAQRVQDRAGTWVQAIATADRRRDERARNPRNPALGV